METNGSRIPLWLGTDSVPDYPPLPGDRSTDVLVVGAGITGITAAALLARAGRKVVLVDALSPLAGESGRTTSHLTQMLDRRYHNVARHFGRDGARLAAQSMRAAIEQVARLVDELHIDCGFERVPGYLYAEDDEQAEEIAREVDAARQAGLEAALAEDVPLPFPVTSALRVDGQAQFHPVSYLRALLEWAISSGCEVFGHTRVVGVHDGVPCKVETSRGTITASSVFVASHVPISNRFFLITKVAAYRTYAVACRLERPFPAGLFWDTCDPYHYTRRHKTADGELLIVGGKDHKVGMEHEPTLAMASLKRYVADRFGYEHFDYEWSGQIEEPSDGLAYIGRNSASRHVYVATGFSGTGTTWGTLAAMIVSDAIEDRPNPFADLYSATRVKPFAMAREYVAENADLPKHLIADRLRKAEAGRVLDVPPGEGRLVDFDGHRVAIYREESGRIHALSPVCRHMGCHVQWNDEEKTWDCPCHGGRYAATGEVLNGPPVTGLAAVELVEEEEEEKAPFGAPEQAPA